MAFKIFPLMLKYENIGTISMVKYVNGFYAISTKHYIMHFNKSNISEYTFIIQIKIGRTKEEIY